MRALILSMALLWAAQHAAAQPLPLPDGARTLPGVAGDGPVTVVAPAPGQPEHADNGRLVVVSHGSGGNPRVHAQLTAALVAAGYTVAFPEHRADNSRDPRNPGPDSWRQRPAEVSRAIDAVAADPTLAARLRLDRVGVYGMSAGGHTALSLAGGEWSPARFRDHCEAHLAEDFQSCVGLITRLTGGPLDGLKQWVARHVIAWRFDDTTPQTHHDPRIAAVAAAVPAAADFDPASLATPRVPLALLTSGQDAWLTPRFHSDRILAACLPRCEHLVALPQGGHGAYLAPLPPGLTGLVGAMLNDPPGFDRPAAQADIDRAVVGFFDRHLGRPAAGRTGAADL